MEKTLINDIVKKYQFLEKQVIAVLNLLEENNTVPFIARYRKEATGGLDEVQIKQIWILDFIIKLCKHVGRGFKTRT